MVSHAETSPKLKQIVAALPFFTLLFHKRSRVNTAQPHNASPTVRVHLNASDTLSSKVKEYAFDAVVVNSSVTLSPHIWKVSSISAFMEMTRSSFRYRKSGTRNHRLIKSVNTAIFKRYKKVFRHITFLIIQMHNAIIKKAAISQVRIWVWIIPVKPITGAISFVPYPSCDGSSPKAYQKPRITRGKKIITPASPTADLVYMQISL